MTKKVYLKSRGIAAQFKELESIAKRFEQEKVDLEKGVADLERGLELAKALKKRLSQIENKVIKIKDDYQKIDD